MDVIVLIGRILFVAIFLASGVAHLTQTRDLEGYVISKGLHGRPRQESGSSTPTATQTLTPMPTPAPSP